MVLISMLPIGLMQTWASVEHGLWYARSSEFLQTGMMNNLRWMRVVGDTIFAAGAVALGIFVVGLKTGWSLSGEDTPVLDELAGLALNEREVVR
jgi:nitric oxide reductase subunit B